MRPSIFQILVAAFLGLWMGMPQTAVALERVLTITSSDGAWVRERDSVTLKPGRQTLVLEGFPATVYPETIQIRPLSPKTGIREHGLRFRYRPVTRASLLRAYEGKDVQVVLYDPRGTQNARLLQRARVLNAGDGTPLLQLEEGVWAGPVEGILFPQVPKTLDRHPLVFWDVEAPDSAPFSMDVERTYEAGGFSWKALYTLTFKAGFERADLAGDVLVENKSDLDLSQARVVLLAGDFNRVRSHRRTRFLEKAAAPMRMEAPAAPVEESPAFEYHLYRLDGPVRLGRGEQLRLPLVRAAAVPVKKRLVSSGSAASYGSWRESEGSTPQAVDIFLEISNDASSGLGKALPAGPVLGAMITEGGAPVPLGEDRIGHTPEGATLKLHFGRSFDVQVRRRLTSFQKISRYVIRCAWELEIRNAKGGPETVELEERVPGQWKVIGSSHPWEKVSAGRLRIPVEVPAKGKVQVRYEIEMDTR
ncbi:hypothetical protein SAMN02746041_00062 [Desulfacinum hydrothermale DSM 13146]|uniref:DUF4139 domain-containing protein n=1 Tax=Desulfacinum hydrothermale DSM 13146 TaxID=1121390 RepID=A0A1W1WXF4_9BACT|nr:hypothetical protein [Desulfacinum hydrothermale]SMC16402.1 hypothetical protein SAMN02746041_00062 [Desulfacinum hydrothermale DSM 13146]